MRLLLDTQIFLWYAQDSKKLSKLARPEIAAADEVFVSAASIWEASIKAGSGKLDVDPHWLIAAIDGSGFSELPVLARHAAAVAKLPRLHGDPFDRLLIAQAIAEPMRLLTADPVLPRYTPLAVLI